MMSEMSQETAAAAQQLVERIRRCSSVAVAFSGGVDSAVVAKAAAVALGARAVAVTAVSPSLSADDLQTAIRQADAIGIRHVQLSTQEFQRPEYRANAADRCFFCKDTLYALLETCLEDLDVECILNGANQDDLGDHRPGMQAAAKYRVRSPLIEEGIDKAMVRSLARFWNLDVADKPASPCLASRIAYGVEVTPERVARVEAAEMLLRQLLGLRELRVRLEAGELARIELPLSELHRLADPHVRDHVAQQFRALGFRYVTLDLEGFRSGSLNAALPLVSLGSAFLQESSAGP